MKSLVVAALFCLSLLTHAQTFITNNGIQIVNSADVVTNGSWTNDAGSSIKNEGTLTTTENWVNNGVWEPTTKGKFVLDYATDKNFTPGGKSIPSLFKKGVGSALVSGSIYIVDTLLLVDGLLRFVNATDTLLAKEDAIVSASAASYVEGKFAHAGNGTKLFPIGRDGNYLPLTLYKVQAVKATAFVGAAPTGYTRGGGVEALIDFPYVWQVSEQLNADTAAYVEVNYPATLPVVANPIVVRGVPGNQYASMGARFIENNTGRVTVRSYSRGLKGQFSIAQGFPSDFKTDSLALVALYNATDGAAGWTTKTNWLVNNRLVSTWSGVTVTGQSITAINLSNNKLKGSVPDLLVDILSLQTINLSNNQITSLPAFTDNPEIVTLNVSGNKLEFGSLEANSALLNPAITFNYANQALIGEATSEQIDVGNNYTVTAATGGGKNSYQWKRNGALASGALSKSYIIESIGRSNMGEYVCEVTNSLFPGLTLLTAVQKAEAVANLSGKLKVSDSSPATKGKVTLFRIENIGGYDTIQVKNVTAAGEYRFEKVVLDDYQIVGFADTLNHLGALPTYYEKNIYWEEADTLFVEGNRIDLDIVSEFKPGKSTGPGVISGYITEDVADAGGRTAREKRVSRAGASVRKVQRTSRPLEEVSALAAYVYSNENGEFELSDLPVGDYRLNIQYPGYPMDETSFINISIGNGLQSQVRVAASVENNKINVKKLVITGVSGEENYTAEVFPNPSADFVTVRFADASPSRTLELLDGTGRKIIAQSATEKDNRMNVRELTPGVYLLRVMDSNTEIKTFKVAVQ